MKINGLHIYGFGQFHNVKIDFESSFQVIYGENEAGKTTILSFIYAILFGFPMKTQNDNRYFPRLSHQYGGNLSIETKGFGNITIERVYDKSKVTGAVKVYLEDGAIKNETFLPEILGSINKEIFQAIYAFDLSGLQNIDNLSSDELGNYLLSAGMVGNGRLQEVEAYLEKKQAELYKPSGRKPLLNEKIESQLALSGQVKVLKGKNDAYYSLKKSLENNRQVVDRIAREKLKIQENIRILERKEQVIPMIQEKRALESQLKQLPNFKDFPENGVERYQSFQDKIIEIDGDIHFYKDEMNGIHKELEQLMINEQIFKYKEDIQKLVSEQNYYRELTYEKSNVIEKIKVLESKSKMFMTRLGKLWDETTILAVQATIAGREEIADLEAKMVQLLQRRSFLDEEIGRKREGLEQLEERERSIQDKLLPNEEKESMQKGIENYLEQKSLNQQKIQLEARERILKPQMKKKGKGWLFPTLLMLAGILFAGYWFSLKEWVVGFLLALSFIGSGGFILSFYKGNISTNELEQVQAEIRRIDAILKGSVVIDEQQAQNWKWKLGEDESLRLELFTLTDRLHQAQQAYMKIVEHYDRFELRWNDCIAEIEEWKRDYHYPMDSNQHLLPEYESILSFQDNYFNIEQEKCRLSNIIEKLEVRNNQITDIYFNVNLSLPDGPDGAQQLHKALEKEQIKLQKRQELEQKNAFIKESLQKLHDRKGNYVKECNVILLNAGVTDENTLILRAKEKDRQQQLSKQHHIIQTQLESTLPKQLLLEINRTENLDVVTEEKQYLTEKRNKMEKEEQMIRKEIAQVEASIKQLEEEGSYSDSLHLLEQERFETRELAKRWAVYKVAEWMIIKTKEKFQKERLPKVIKLASSYLEKLTNGNYTNIYLSNNQKEAFLLERRDKQRFSTIEVSRGTVEQLYLAIRLALVVEYQSKEIVPLVLDDILVNFDGERTLNSITILKELAGARQILFFTCHKHILKYFKIEDIIELKEITVRV